MTDQYKLELENKCLLLEQQVYEMEVCLSVLFD